MIDPLYAASGLCVGILVGMTGVGGGSLMTPVLILLFGVHPAAAVGTDLMYAAATKTGGTVFHGFARSIDWPIVRRLASGSLPATIVTLYLMSYLNLDGAAARTLITIVLSFGLAATAAVLIFRHKITSMLHTRMMGLDPGQTAAATVFVGAVVGVLVSISSVGAGAIGATALIILYPRLPIVKIVGSDIAHAVPLTLAAGTGHWMLGTIDWHVVGSLLVGSWPGILLGSYLAFRLPETALRLLLAATLLVVAGKLAIDSLHSLATATATFAGKSTP